jgi:lipopolysaccharide/colanic/teichoic acid biosynthesis glycosyltransferase
MKPELNETAVKTGTTGAGQRTDRTAIRPVQTGGIVLWKRILDLTCLLVASPVALPLMLVISLGIKLVSSGPILFRQERIGYRGRPFTLYKFRSMEVSVDKEVHERYMGQLMQSDVPMEKLDVASGPELISWGWLLRASGLDELPQVFNVIRGEMSLVGPRPCMAYEYERYLPWHKLRFNTLPGITGLWQVSGKNKTTFTQKMRLDIEYTERKSLGLDLKILSKTALVLVVQIKEMHLGQTKAKGRTENNRYPRPIETKH